MIRWFSSRYLWGGMFILIGLIFLLDYFGFVGFTSLLWTLIFGLGGIILFSSYFSNHENWWAIIPGGTLISIALLIGLEYIFPESLGDFGGSIVLWGIGLSFALVYLVDHENWWAIIPAGVLISIGIVVGFSTILAGELTAAFFFIGLGSTFAILALIPTPEGKMRWAWIPALVLLGLGLALLIISEDIFRIIGALGLIALGGFLIYRTLRSRDQGS